MNAAASQRRLKPIIVVDPSFLVTVPLETSSLAGITPTAGDGIIGGVISCGGAVGDLTKYQLSKWQHRGGLEVGSRFLTRKIFWNG